MAENEERIVIFNGVFNNNVDTTIYPDSGMTRAEAVERIAKSLYNKEQVSCNKLDCKQYRGLDETCEGCQLWEKYEHLAKAALDALLGENK